MSASAQSENESHSYNPNSLPRMDDIVSRLDQSTLRDPRVLALNRELDALYLTRARESAGGTPVQLHEYFRRGNHLAQEIEMRKADLERRCHGLMVSLCEEIVRLLARCEPYVNLTVTPKAQAPDAVPSESSRRNHDAMPPPPRPTYLSTIVEDEQDEDTIMESSEAAEPLLTPTDHTAAAAPAPSLTRAPSATQPGPSQQLLDEERDRQHTPPATATGGGGSVAVSSPSRPRSRSRKLRSTIPFDEVYQNGEAEIKYTIVERHHENPERGQNGDFWIFQCLKHDVHVTKIDRGGTLKSASKHLTHYHKVKGGGPLTFDRIGLQVTGCTPELMERNNASVVAAIANGYKERNGSANGSSRRPKTGRTAMGNQSRARGTRPAPAPAPAAQPESSVHPEPVAQSERASEPEPEPIVVSDGEAEEGEEERPTPPVPRVDDATTATATASASSSSSSSSTVLPPEAPGEVIAHPQVGEVYTLALPRGAVAGLRLPMGDFAEVSLSGTLDDSMRTARLGHLPSCWLRMRTTGAYQFATNWHDGQKDGQRQFPFLLFDRDSGQVEDCSLRWVKAKNLRKFNEQNIEPRYRALVEAYRQRRHEAQTQPAVDQDVGSVEARVGSLDRDIEHQPGAAPIQSGGDAANRDAADPDDQTSTRNELIDRELAEAVAELANGLSDTETLPGPPVTSDIPIHSRAPTASISSGNTNDNNSNNTNDDGNDSDGWDAPSPTELMPTMPPPPSDPESHRQQTPRQPSARMSPTTPPPMASPFFSERPAAHNATLLIQEQQSRMAQQAKRSFEDDESSEPPEGHHQRRATQTPNRPRPSASSASAAGQTGQTGQTGPASARSLPRMPGAQGTPCKRSKNITRFPPSRNGTVA